MKLYIRTEFPLGVLVDDKAAFWAGLPLEVCEKVNDRESALAAAAMVMLSPKMRTVSLPDPSISQLVKNPSEFSYTLFDLGEP